MGSLAIFKNIGDLICTQWYPNLQMVEGELSNNLCHIC